MYIRRKVYSIAEDDYGYENLYSVNDTYMDEDLYSVTMTEDEARLFSDFCEYLYSEEGKVQSGRDIGQLAGGALGAGAAGVGAYKYLMGSGERGLKNYHAGKRAKEAALDAKEKAMIESEKASQKIGKMGNREWEAYKKANKIKTSQADEALRVLREGDSKAKRAFEKADKAAARQMRKGYRNAKVAKWLGEHGGKKLAIGAGVGAGLAGLGAGAAVGRPLGGALNRGND